MSARRTGLGLAAAVALLVGAAPAGAAPGDYVLEYDWSGDGDGFAGWAVTEEPALGTPGFQTPYYASQLALPKLRIAPTPAADGTADRVYPAVDAFGPRRRALVQAPGTTRIRSATFDDADYRRATGERQTLRLAVYGADPPDADNVYDFRSDTPPRPGVPGMYLSDTPYTGVGPITVDPAEAGGSAQVWLATSCDPSCPTVGFDPGGVPRSYGQVGSVLLDLFDPEAPAVDAYGPLTTGAWTNAREPQGAGVTATDPGSGIRTVTAVRRRQGGAAVRTLDARPACDDAHATGQGPGREAAACPDRYDTSFTQSLASLPDGQYSYEVTATDDSERTATRTFALRLDRGRPATVSGSGPLRSLVGRWSNRTDRVALVARGRDSRSGISRLELVAESPDGTQQIVAAADAACGGGCAPSFAATLTADLNRLPDGRTSVLVRAFDAAGNANERRIGTLLLDRVAPPPPLVGLRVVGNSTLLTINPQPDPAPGSGVASFVANYRRATSTGLRTLRQQADVGEVRGRGTRARIAGRTSGEVPVRSVDRAGNVGRAFASGPPHSCPEMLVGPNIIRSAKIAEIRPGVDTTGSISYGERGDHTLELSGAANVKGVGVTLTESFTRSRADRKSRNVDAREGYNVGIEIVLRKEILAWVENGKRVGNKECPRTAGPKTVYRVTGSTGADLVMNRMPRWQDGRADCRNEARWRGKRRRYPGDGDYSKANEKTNTFAAGLSILGVGFKTQNTYSRDSRVTYSRGTKYRWYWLCGDGGGRDPAGDPDPRTWLNLFAGADTASGRAR